MSVTTSEPTAAPDYKALYEALLAKQQEVPAAPKTPSRFKAQAKRIGKGIIAAFASTDAVKKEKSLAALIITRVLINVGASAATVDAIRLGLEALGVKF